MSVLKIKNGNDWESIPTIKGEAGDAAGFGTATATVDTNTGTPSCVVTLSGDDTAKNFDFAFHNLMYDDSDLQSDFSDLQGDFTTLQGQFDTAVAALTVDSEVADIRVGDDGVTYNSAGNAVRTQLSNVKADLSDEETARIALAGRVTTAEGDIYTLETHKVAQPLDEHNQPTDGTDGQLLRTKGDGSTEWVDEGLPTDEQTAQAVSDWLDAHPEATTTVQDRSLTYEKLVIGTLGYVTPEMFGAKGDGVTDDTTALQEAFLYPFVRIPQKTYKITDTLTISSNEIIADGAIINASFASYKYKVLDFISDDYINIIGLKVNANSKGSVCFFIGNDTNSTTLKRVNIEQCSANNTNNGLNQTNSAGIFIYRNNEAVSIKECTISGVYRNSSNSGVIASIGIHVSHIIGICEISNNIIDGVYYEVGVPYDADGIHVFTKNATTAEAENTAIIVSNNVIINCQGRFVKGQGENIKIEGNTCKNNNIALIDNFTGIDCQTAGGFISNNTIILLDWTSATQAHYVTISGRDYTKLQNCGKIHDNYFYSNVQLFCGIIISCALSVPTAINISNNRIENAKTMLYVSGTSSVVENTYIIYLGNILTLYTTSITIDSAILDKVNIFKNYNAGSIEANLDLANVTVPNTVTTVKDFLLNIYSQVLGIGVSMGSAVWVSYGTFTYIANRTSATRADVIVYYNAHIYRMYYENDNNQYFFDYPGSLMS